MLSKIFGGAAESGNERSGETILHPDELEKIGTEGDQMRVLLGIIFSLLALAACLGCQKASGEQATGEPKGGQDARVEARAGGEGGAMARVGDDGGVVARAGDGAVARAGAAVARAGGRAEARVGDAVTKAESRAESQIQSSGDGGKVREATLEIEGDPGTGFSGTCTIGDEEREVSGQVPERFVFELDGQRLECEIHKQSTGTMNVVVDADGVDHVLRTDSRRATVRIVYSGQGYSSSIQSSSGSSGQIINSSSSSHSSSIVSSSSTRTR